MTAISGTRRAFKELVDGSIRVQIDIDPRFKKEFLETFGAIDMPVAIAPLVADFEQREPPKGGALCRLAAMWCKDETFQEWLGKTTEEEAADDIRVTCEIKSRTELDHNPRAAALFNEHFREPYREYLAVGA